MLEILRNTPADYFLHPCLAFYAFIILRKLFDTKWTVFQIMALSICKEFYDLIYTTGWSWRDMAMNVLGILIAFVGLKFYSKLKTTKNG